MIARPSQVRGELGLTDREMDLSRSQTWLRRRIFSTFSHVKPNRWFALLEIAEYKQCINDFLGMCNARVLFVVCLQNGQLRPHLGTVDAGTSIRSSQSRDRNKEISTATKGASVDIDMVSLRADVSQSMGTLMYFLKRSGTHRKNNVLTSEALSSSLIVGETITHIWPRSGRRARPKVDDFSSSSSSSSSSSFVSSTTVVEEDLGPPGNIPLSQLGATLVVIFGRVLQNQDTVKTVYGWPGVLAEDMLQHVHEFKAKLDVVIGESGGRVVLPLPLPAKQIAVETPNMLHVLEGTCMSWWKQIESVMVSGDSDVATVSTTETLSSSSSSIDGEGAGGGGNGGGVSQRRSVSAEIEMWQTKARNLESIVRQLQSTRIQHVLQVLEELGSTYVQDFQTRSLLVHDALEEARDNARFLAPLVPVVGKIRRDIEADFPTVVMHLRPMYRTLMNIWQISNFYNTSQRMGNMLQSMCRILVEGAVKWVDLDELLGSRSEATKKQLHEVLALSDVMMELFDEFSQRIRESTPEHDWSHIDDAVTFSVLRKFSIRCKDVLELLETGEQFSRLKSINVATDRGRMLTGMVFAIHEEFQLHYGRFQPGNRTYSILRPGDSRFDRQYVLFRRSLRDWDVRLAAVLEQGFDDCIMIRSQDVETDDGAPVGLSGQMGADENPGSLSAALQLLREFGSLLRRDVLAGMLQRKFPNLLRAFMSELDDVKHIFISYQKLESEVPSNDTGGGGGGTQLNSYAQRCMDFRALMQRIREPYNELLYHCPSNMKEGKNELVERIKSRYSQLCTTIETAVKGIYQEFIVWVESVIAGGGNSSSGGSSSSTKTDTELPTSAAATTAAAAAAAGRGEKNAQPQRQGVAEGLRRTIFCRTDVLDKIQAMNMISHITLDEEFERLQVDSFIDETDLPLLFHRCGLRLTNEEMLRGIEVLHKLQKESTAAAASSTSSSTTTSSSSTSSSSSSTTTSSSSPSSSSSSLSPSASSACALAASSAAAARRVLASTSAAASTSIGASARVGMPGALCASGTMPTEEAEPLGRGALPPLRFRQPFRLTPGPPNLGLSWHVRHAPQSLSSAAAAAAAGEPSRSRGLHESGLLLCGLSKCVAAETGSSGVTGSSSVQAGPLTAVFTERPSVRDLRWRQITVPVSPKANASESPSVRRPPSGLSTEKTNDGASPPRLSSETSSFSFAPETPSPGVHSRFTTSGIPSSTT